MSVERAQVVWGVLQKGINEIQNGNASKLKYEELYRNAYNLVLNKHGSMLYDGVKRSIEEKVQEVFRIVSPTPNATFLQVSVTQWERHKLTMTMIRDVLMYMDKTFCVRNKKTVIYDVGMELFRDIVVKHESVLPRLQKVLLENILSERQHEPINRTLMKSALSMLVEVNVSSKSLYQEEFENAFLKETQTFYIKEAQFFLNNNTVPDYLKKIEARLLEEEDRASAYLDESSKKKLMDVVEAEVITKYAEQLIKNSSSGAIPMFTKDMLDDLKRMYRLFSRIPSSLTILKDEMRSFVRESGEKIVSDEENKKNPNKFVQEVLDMRLKYFKIVSESFGDDRRFSRTLKESFEHFINLDARAAQYLSLFIDEMIKNSSKDLSEDIADQKLDQVITIFRYLSDKDVFEDFYKQHLASRLLMGKTSDDLEKSMIAKLKAECGHQFTSKMEGMFKNIDLSKEINEEFSKYLSVLQPDTSSGDLPEMNVNVLTSGIWPFSLTDPCTLPVVIQKRMTQFQDFYYKKHAGHRLTWQTSLGTANILCAFPAGDKEFQVHTYQMCLMYLFNDAESYTFAQLLELTQIPDKELERHLLSLAHPKVKILKKSPNTKKCESDHTFAYNPEFASKQYRIKVKLLSPMEATGTDDASAVSEEVMEARKNRVEAAIVRIMKARQRMEHNSLVAEVLKQLSSRFTADPTFIKKRVESLIERDYLQRDKDDRRIYEYLA